MSVFVFAFPEFNNAGGFNNAGSNVRLSNSQLHAKNITKCVTVTKSRAATALLNPILDSILDSILESILDSILESILKSMPGIKTGFNT